MYDHQYKKISGEKNFFICDGILMYGKRVVIPRELKKIILKYFHTGHTGIAGMKALMRSYGFCPNMD